MSSPYFYPDRDVIRRYPEAHGVSEGSSCDYELLFRDTMHHVIRHVKMYGETPGLYHAKTVWPVREEPETQEVTEYWVSHLPEAFTGKYWKPVTKNTHAGGGLCVIKCPHCARQTNTHHFRWTQLTCGGCMASVNKCDWLVFDPK